MQPTKFPVIDLHATGRNITRLRKARGLTVRDIQAWFGFEEPQAIYKWQSGRSLPTVDNLYALSTLLEVPMDEILVSVGREADMDENGQQAESCCPSFISMSAHRLFSLLRTGHRKKGGLEPNLLRREHHGVISVKPKFSLIPEP